MIPIQSNNGGKGQFLPAKARTMTYADYVRRSYDALPSPSQRRNTAVWWANAAETVGSVFVSIWTTVPLIVLASIASAWIGVLAHSFVSTSNDHSDVIVSMGPLAGAFVIAIGIFKVRGLLLFIATVGTMFLAPYIDNRQKRARVVLLLCLWHVFNAFFFWS